MLIYPGGGNMRYDNIFVSSSSPSVQVSWFFWIEKVLVELKTVLLSAFRSTEAQGQILVKRVYSRLTLRKKKTFLSQISIHIEKQAEKSRDGASLFISLLESLTVFNFWTQSDKSLPMDTRKGRAHPLIRKETVEGDKGNKRVKDRLEGEAKINLTL